MEGCASRSQRIATFCREVARSRGMGDDPTLALIGSALENVGPTAVRMLDRLSSELGFGPLRDDGQCESQNRHLPQELAEEQVGVQNGKDFHDILEAACHFDELLEFNQFEGSCLAETLKKVREEPLDFPFAAIVLAELKGCTRESVTALTDSLPVFPKIASEAIGLLKSDNTTVGLISDLVSSDPVLAGQLVRAANRVGLVTTSLSVRSVDAAVRRLGTTASVQVVLTESLKPVMAVQGHSKMWAHAVEAAAVSRFLAQSSNIIDPNEAYLVGLLHDCGALLLRMGPQPALALRNRLALGGCPVLIAELLSFGLDHASASGEVLAFWNFSPDQVEAVTWHHEPEHTRSRLSSLLYVVEHWVGAEEDLPSNIRLKAALENLGLSSANAACLRTAPPC